MERVRYTPQRCRLSPAPRSSVSACWLFHPSTISPASLALPLMSLQRHSRLFSLLLFALALPGAVLAAAPAGPPKGKASGKAPAKAAPPGLTFRVQQLHVDNNEGCAVADFNRDGKLDVSAGEFWYAGPDFTTKQPLRKLQPFGRDYLTNCGEHAYDVNGDGFPDIVSGAFMDAKVYWYQNPGPAGLAAGSLWEQHELIDTKLAQNEWSDFRDLDGDGVPEYIINSYGAANAVMAYRFGRDAQVRPVLLPWMIQPGAPFVNGHGMGFGDINGDGREDMVYGNGWYERPVDATARPWKRHADWTFPQASTPMIVVDLSGDGRNDLIWGHGHNYGLWWEERRDDNQDGSTNWRHHLIDDKFSQVHALVWEDLDRDGQPDLVTGRRVRAHSGNDPGDNEPGALYYFTWNSTARRFTKHPIATDGPGTGLQIRVADFDGNGWKDLAVAGKSGTHILWNQGK
jgi:hypothetical protein